MQVYILLNCLTLARAFTSYFIPFFTLVPPEMEQQSYDRGGKSVDGHRKEYTLAASLEPSLIEVGFVFMEQELIQKGALLFEVCINHQRQNSQVDELGDEGPPSQHLLLCRIVRELDSAYYLLYAIENNLIHSDQNDISRLGPPKETLFGLIISVANRP
jgi:hypothetical protein